MSLTLSATDTITGVAGSATSITCTISGDEIDVAAGTDTFKVLYQGQLPSSVGTLVAAASGKLRIIKLIQLVNGTGGSVTARLNVNGTAAANAILPATAILAGGHAILADDGWKFYNDQGQLLSVGATGATGAAGVDGADGADGAGYGGTSTTSLAIATGSTAFTTQAGLAYVVGSRVRAASAADPADFMEGIVTGYTGTTLTVLVDLIGGTGTDADWNLSIAGEPGQDGSSAIPTDTFWDAKGDLAVGTGANTAARLPVGANGSYPRANSATTTGLEWQLNNLAASAAPAVTDDSGDGYSIGSRWIDTTADKEYVCLDASVGAAVWTETTGIGGGATDDPTAEIFGNPATAFEFSTSSLTGLTAMGTPDVVNADTTVPGHLYIQDNASVTAWCGYYAAKTAAAAFTAICRLSDQTVRANYNGAGLFVGEATPGKLATWQIGGVERWVKGELFSNPTTYNTALGSTGPSYLPVHFLAIVVNTTSDIDLWASVDGRAWFKRVDAGNPGLTIGSVGLALKSEHADGCAVAFDYLRIWDSALTFPGV